MENPFGHSWFKCGCCGDAVLCGKCGNNACNGGYGTLPDGSTCDACPTAYDIQNAATYDDDGNVAFDPIAGGRG